LANIGIGGCASVTALGIGSMGDCSSMCAGGIEVALAADDDSSSDVVVESWRRVTLSAW
jgi:hypothetical protein